MEIVDNIKLYLPQYLSEAGRDKLWEELAKFPTDGTKGTIYTSALESSEYLLQGDAICDVDYMNFPDCEIRKVRVILLSNTCDMSTDNKRMYSSRIMYAPILNLQKYEETLKKEFPPEKVDSHIEDIKKQRVTQALYLPKGGKLDYDGIVFFDRAISIVLSKEAVSNMCKNRLFTFSDFGFYLFLLKLSVHFTRVQEKIDRSTGVDMGI